jgi:type II secretory pathway component PulK
MNNAKGQAVLVALTFLILLFIVGVAFFSLSQTERTSSIRNLDGLRARYIAEAGVTYAMKVLKLDKQTNLIDTLQDMTFTNFSGEDLDLDGDGKPESRWFNIVDSQGKPFGRFSVKISDEASKIHLNLSQNKTLEQIFSQSGIESPKANTLLNQRPFNALEQIGSILDKQEFNLSKDFLTVYSGDLEVDLDRRRRAYLNSASAQVILEAFLTAGLNSPFKKAANIKDASDADLSQTILYSFSRNNLAPSSLLESGSWVKVGDFYEAPAGGSPGRFHWSNLPVDDADYYCFFYAQEDTDVIGEVYLDEDENSRRLLLQGEPLTKKVKVSSGALTINIQPAKDKTSRFSHIELASLNPEKGLMTKIATGTEAVVINELMVKPSKELLIDSPVSILSGESFLYTFTGVNPGSYYVVVRAIHKGGLVGDVNIGGRTGDDLYDGDYFPSAVNVSDTGDLTLEVKNNSLSTSSFKGIRISQQPDAEFIEVLNISPEELDLSNFSFEVYSGQDELIPGWPARIPEGTKIEPYQYLVFVVDNNDSSPSPQQLRGNGVSFKTIWGFNGTGLIFDEYSDTIDKHFDLLPDERGKVILKDNLERLVDAVEYKQNQVRDFVSLERACPSEKTDEDENGLFDNWYLSENKALATPGYTNNNSGMYTRDGEGNLIKHSPSEVVVFNRKLKNFSEVIQLADGRNWGKITLQDASLIADHFAYEAIELDLAGHYIGGEFKELDGTFESLHNQDTGIWEFKNIARGTYLLSIFSENLVAEGQIIQAGYRTDTKEDFRDFSTLLFTQGLASYGSIEFKEDAPVFQLKIINNTEKRLALEKIQFEPVNSTSGRINVNTAKPEVLRSILISDTLVDSVLQNRPIGIKGNRRLGVGELFLLHPDFLTFHNYLTVKSDVYEINCRGEYFPSQKTLAFQSIRTVVDRGN